MRIQITDLTYATLSQGNYWYLFLTTPQGDQPIGWINGDGSESRFQATTTRFSNNPHTISAIKFIKCYVVLNPLPIHPPF